MEDKKYTITKMGTVLLLLMLASCQKKTNYMPTKDEVTTSAPLPIDGLYETSSNIDRKMRKIFGIVDIDRQRVRFEKGIAYYEESPFGKMGGSPDVEPGKVCMKDIKPVTESKYVAAFYPLGKDTIYSVTILVEGNDLKINMPMDRSTGAIKIPQEINFELLE